jgi:glycosyltransferase involved in cell wall biosynthesis
METDWAADAVVIIEPVCVGHRFYFVRLLAEAAARLGRSAVLVSHHDSVPSDEWRVHLAAIPSLRVVTLKSRDFRGIRLLRLLHRLRRPGNPVIVPRADRHVLVVLLSQLLARALSPRRHGYGELRCLLLRPDLRPGRRQSVKAWACRALTLLGEPPLLLDDVVIRGRLRGSLAGAWVADPVGLPLVQVTRHEARASLGLNPNGTTIGLVGVLNARKSVRLVLDTWLSLTAEFRLLLVGRTDADTHRLLTDERFREHLDSGRIRLVEGHVSDATLQLSIRASDVILLPYRSTGSSGLLGQTIRLGTPVVAAGNPRITGLVEALDIGVRAELTSDSLAAAIRTCVGQDRSDQMARARERLSSEGEFAEAVLGPRIGSASGCEGSVHA